jgi:uncharacterized membrane protein (DUF106 family)
MEKINQFFKDHGSKIIIALLILIYFKSCGVDSELTKLKKEAKANAEAISNLPTANDIKIEGLRSEKRMIQATDRKMLDVQRQSEIEKEIKILEGK